MEQAKKVKLEFTEVLSAEIGAHYTDGCSGGVSACCTRVCTRNEDASSENLEDWNDYFAINAGVIQY